MPRELTVVVQRVLDVVPESQHDMRVFLNVFLRNLRYTAPERYVEMWKEFGTIINDFIPDVQDESQHEDWHRAVVRAFLADTTSSSSR